MKRHTISAPARHGFTLVELLVVIAIVAILSALTSGAVMRFISKGDEAKNRSDLSQLATSMAQFKVKFGFYPPSRIKLARVINNTTYPQLGTPGTLDAESVNTIRRMFPSINWDNTPANAKVWLPNLTGNQTYTLEGDQCLVFFLGGMQDQTGTPGCDGFSTNPVNPLAGGGTRIGPFYNFQSNRLVLDPRHANGPRNAFSYLDPYGTPYAYFSSYDTRNGYNRYSTTQSDCSVLGVFPWAESAGNAGNPTRFHNPETFQILSAGRNKVFGTGTNPGAPMYYTSNSASALPKPAKDDISNFTQGTLESGL